MASSSPRVALIEAGIRGRHGPDRSSRYRHQGTLATIERKATLAEFGRLHLAGLPGWLLWAAAHVWFLIGWRNRLVVSLR
jgi:NADH:ubiquinone reductase (H+-translocating)